MGKLKKKGTSGTATTYLSRNRVLKKLQLSLADFRRLCILKGVYPREPQNRKKLKGGTSSMAVFYHAKDILHLMHEPLLAKFREFKSFSKKWRKLIGKREWKTAEKFEQNKPIYTLDHIIKERYPTFVDALRDLDDALCHVFLFAGLPSHHLYNTSQRQECQQLVNQWLAFLAHRHALRKVFFSVKGIYYQVELSGQLITWLSPYEFTFSIPETVDFKVMLTFLEFYQNLLRFVHWKLWNDAGLVYPPKSNEALSDEMGDSFATLLIQSKDAQLGLVSDVTNESKVPRKKTNKSTTPHFESKLKSLEEKLPEILIHDSAHREETETQGQQHRIRNDDDDDGDENEDDIVHMDDFQRKDEASLNLLTEAQKIQQKNQELQAIHSLFSSHIIFISREVSRDTFIFLIKSFGGKVGWAHCNSAGSPYLENDPRITIQLIDRPSVPEAIYPGRVYVQPQWIPDCINQRKLLKVEVYAPSATLPPHYSPFVEEEEEDSMSDMDESKVHIHDSLEEAENKVLKKSLHLDVKKEKKNENENDQEITKKTVKVKLDHPEEKEKKELALSLLSKKKRKLYEAMQRGLRNKEKEKATLKAKRLKLKRETLSTFKNKT